jgi:hypothetical protein
MDSVVVIFGIEVLKMPDEDVQSNGGVEGRSRHRSPNYPAVALPEAIERVSKFYSADRKAGAPLETALKHMGFSGRHGKSMMVVSALKKYGLVEDVAGRLVPTQRAVEIIVLPRDDSRRLQAIREAALSPDVNRELFEKYQGDGFPAVDTLASELVAYKGFNPGVVENFVRSFFETMEFASLTGAIELPSKSERLSDGASASQATTSEPTRAQEGQQGRPAGSDARIEANKPLKPSRRFIWPLSKDITAIVEFMGGEVNKTHIDLLQKYLELAKVAVQMDTSESQSNAE